MLALTNKELFNINGGTRISTGPMALYNWIKLIRKIINYFK